jgi:hypothetical protein
MVQDERLVARVEIETELAGVTQARVRDDLRNPLRIALGGGFMAF